MFAYQVCGAAGQWGANRTVLNYDSATCALNGKILPAGWTVQNTNCNFVLISCHLREVCVFVTKDDRVQVGQIQYDSACVKTQHSVLEASALLLDCCHTHQVAGHLRDSRFHSSLGQVTTQEVSACMNYAASWGRFGVEDVAELVQFEL